MKTKKKVDVRSLESDLAGLSIGKNLLTPGTFLKRVGKPRYQEEGATPHVKKKAAKDDDWSPPSKPAASRASLEDDDDDYDDKEDDRDDDKEDDSDDVAYCKKIAAGFERRKGSSPIPVLRGDNAATPGAFRYVRSYAETPVTSRSDDSNWTPDNKENVASSPATTAAFTPDKDEDTPTKD